MVVVSVCVGLAGLLCGWLLLHGLAIGVLNLGIAVACASLGRWEPLLILRLFDVLALFQVSFLIGAAARVGWDERARGQNTRDGTDTRREGERVPVVEDDPLIATPTARGSEASSDRSFSPAVADARRLIGRNGIGTGIGAVRHECATALLAGGIRQTGEWRRLAASRS